MNILGVTDLSITDLIGVWWIAVPILLCFVILLFLLGYNNICTCKVVF